ncbi:MAG: methylmalonyl Co-A mutase-associated GTPase MeaB [Chloroflexota bacterium]|nr:methylmalonyl Co-A mutase-associated GTPase MeaB [Chloroflexota bacterium]
MTATATDKLIERFRSGERPALARLLTYVENERPAGLRAMAELYRDTGNAYVVGITGPPGAGKSTLTNAVIRAYRGRGKTVGVLAIDPSSSLTGGATLGDRIRMLENYEDDGVYIRSMATRGEMGGLSMAVGAVTHLLDAYGFDIIVVETVGVGQDEVDVAELADTTLLLQVPGLGDSIQTIKAGVLEIADILVVNKADIKGAENVVRDLRNMLRLGEHGPWLPPILRTVAVTGDNIDALLDTIDKHRAHLESSGEGKVRRERRARREVLRLAQNWLTSQLEGAIREPAMEPMLEKLRQRDINPFEVAEELARRTSLRVQSRG